MFRRDLKIIFLAVTSIGQTLPRVGSQSVFYFIQEGCQTTVVAGIVALAAGHNQLELAIHGQLAVAALLEPVCRFHVLALWVRKVSLILVIRHPVIPFEVPSPTR